MSRCANWKHDNIVAKWDCILRISASLQTRSYVSFSFINTEIRYKFFIYKVLKIAMSILQRYVQIKTRKHIRKQQACIQYSWEAFRYPCTVRPRGYGREWSARSTISVNLSISVLSKARTHRYLLKFFTYHHT